MNPRSIWLGKKPSLKTTLAVLTLSTFSSSLFAAPLNKADIKFIGPIAADMQLKPYQTEHQDAIINNLLPSLQQPKKSITVFGEKLKWQSFDSVNALTLGGLQALKLTASAERFTQGTLTIKGIEKAQLFINSEKQTPTKDVYELALSQGDHQIVIIAEQVANWNDVEFDFTAKTDTHTLTFSSKEQHGLSAKQLFDAPTVSALSLSPDAKQHLVSTRHYQDSTGNTANTVTELKDDDNRTIYRFESGQPSNVIWSPDNNYIVYLLEGKLKQLNRKTLSLRVIAENLDGAGGFSYFDNTSLIFNWSKSPTADSSLTKHYKGLQDRWSYARITSQVYLLDINTGLSKILSQGPLSHSIEDFNSKRGTVLLSRGTQPMLATTHPTTELIELNIANGKSEVIGLFNIFNQAKYSNNDIYVTAGPDFKDGLGRNLPEDMLSNNYDGQLYLLTDNGKKASALSRNFDPAIGQLEVLNNGDAIVKVTDQDTIALYLYDKSKQRFNKLKTGFDVVEQFSYSNNRSPAILVSGSNASSPQQLKQLSINKNKAKTLWDSKPEGYANTDIASLDEFNFTNAEGVEIKGRVYLPTDLDKNKQYPALVYYYGGTSPVTRGFTGRYPFNLWAEHGYVVYVVQPTGATGFGQEFSAKHVNAWGQYTADDIMQGTQALLKQYPFIDKNRLGNLGASYGGFMTMLLATKTDMFSASIAHAGISNITSYWGQGWWGYLYSGEASKNSYPWNNATLYSDHSPVFHADKVTTPLLLLHGDSDTNVPVGESHNMYTALKLLGKDVDLIEYKGADHQIFARDQRFDWWSTKLAYFDQHLKNEPQWWQYLYPKK
ncbi:MULTISPECIES: alpha/beta hydrolase family protein [Pseudoalteromonas]|uniref:Hydrolase n=1 Tax=Pseudoalteromonas porphyrae TaxID=187330 RepID=A0A0N0LX05_9GAMM|nr:MULTISPECIES: prolyl oligopeptidase family serine peptidase [Pseudoalteromonas]KPH60011.1 hydrolase [Pseudoalteromonas porphyrae]NMR27947.1 S9 family peptidase [Pseudoalteromonas sp. NEC-BIFX-2020_015]